MTDAHHPPYNVVGERVALGPMRSDLIPLYQRWDNDLLTSRTTARFRPTTSEQHRTAFDEFTRHDSYALFTLYELASGHAIGTTYLAGIEPRNRTAEFGIAIGESDSRRRGFGTEATRLTLDYAFNALGLHSAMLWVYAYNPAAIRCYTKVGFREIGRRRPARWHNGRFWEEIAMDILATEFASPVLRRVPELELQQPS